MKYRTSLSLHRASDGAFSSWSLDSCTLLDGRIELVTTSEALSPVIPAEFPFSACVPSWNAELSPGCYLELFLRIRSGEHWSPWVSMGQWAPLDGSFKRHSVAGQEHEDLRVATDTLETKLPADAFQAKFMLHADCDTSKNEPCSCHASIRAFSLACSDPKPTVDSLQSVSQAGSTLPSGCVIGKVPQCSQMVYPNGGNVWCSPTSVSMVLGYWRGDEGPCESRVRAAVAGVYDHVFDGHGNWSFNVAYAGSVVGMEAYVARFTGLDRLEPWIAAGVPIVLSVSWNNEEGRLLSAAPVVKSAGHLTTLVGFDEQGNAVMNEPASPSNETVRRVYDRRELETRWLCASGGTAYIIFPSGSGKSDLAENFAKSVF
ncbi:peptidase C39 family protein [Spirochaetota bacterium]